MPQCFKRRLPAPSLHHLSSLGATSGLLSLPAASSCGRCRRSGRCSGRGGGHARQQLCCTCRHAASGSHQPRVAAIRVSIASSTALRRGSSTAVWRTTSAGERAVQPCSAGLTPMDACSLPMLARFRAVCFSGFRAVTHSFSPAFVLQGYPQQVRGGSWRAHAQPQPPASYLQMHAARAVACSVLSAASATTRKLTPPACPVHSPPTTRLRPPRTRPHPRTGHHLRRMRLLLQVGNTLFEWRQPERHTGLGSCVCRPTCWA